MNFLYVLPRYDYFKKGRNGSVTHAEGIAEGLIKNEVEVNILSGPNSHEFMATPIKTLLSKEVSKFSWFVMFVFELIRAGKNHKDGVVVVRFSTKYCLLISTIFKVFGIKNWGFELNSFNYVSIKSKYLRLFVKKYEAYSLSQASFVNTVSDSLTKKALMYNKCSFTLPNAGPCEPTTLREKCTHDKNTLNVVYMGAIRDYFDILGLIKVISELDNVKLHIFGKIGLLSSLNENELNARNVYYYGSYNLESVFESDVFKDNFYFILPYKAGSVADIGSPTKLFEYLSLGVPIISTKVGQPFELLKDAQMCAENIAYFYDNTENDGLKKLLLKLMNEDISYDREEILKFYFNNHTWKVRCSEYLTKIKSFTGI